MNNQDNTIETKIYAEKFWKGMRGTRGVVDELVISGVITCRRSIMIGCWKALTKEVFSVGSHL